jgi:2-hydroxy-6-oxonona-2,4-dienedioate hydrolase
MMSERMHQQLEGGAGLSPTFVHVDGVPVYTLVSNTAPAADAPPLVLVHGLALSGRYMLATARVLLRHYRVYVPDLPGFGDSGKPPRVLDVPGLADALSAWMRAAGLGPAMLLGNSFACQIIAECAARHPEQVERGVLQGPTTPPDERSWIRQFIRWRQNAPFSPQEMDDIAYSDYKKCGYLRALKTFRYSLRHRLEDTLPHIEAPMLVVRGEVDPICHQWWAEEVARKLPNGRLVIIPDVAHTLVFTHPRELAKASLPFLAEHRPAGANAVAHAQRRGAE